MPKFSFKEQNKLNLTIMLNKIGLSNLFNDKEANFNKILCDNNNKLCLNNIFQINLLDVDEMEMNYLIIICSFYFFFQ